VNEKRIKNIIIIVLSVAFIISTAIAIYYGRTGSIDYANQLRDTINRLESNNDELRTANAEQGRTLTSVLDDLEHANQYITELEHNHGLAIGVSRRTNERLIEFTSSMGTIGTDITGLIERQRRIDIIVRELWEDNREFRAALGISD